VIISTCVEADADEIEQLLTVTHLRPSALGEAVPKGTGIEVHRVAALLGGGMTPAQICEDYPSLPPDAVATAKAYADAHPKAGRPYPSRTVKRAIRGAGTEALDEVLDEER